MLENNNKYRRDRPCARLSGRQACPLKRIIFSLILFGLVITGGVVNLYAAIPASDEMKQEFEQKMERNWYSASDKEQKIFLRSRELIKQKKSGHVNNQKKKKRIQRIGGYKATSLAVRYGFEKQGKERWEDASKEEKEEFKKGYFKKEEQRRKTEERLEKQKRKQEESRKKKLLNEKKTKEKRKQAKIKEAQRKAKAVRKKREDSRKKMEESRKKMERLRRQSRRRR